MSFVQEVLRVDRRVDSGLPVHLPADVDLQAGVRRVRSRHCPPEVLLEPHVMLCAAAAAFVHFVLLIQLCPTFYNGEELQCVTNAEI